MVNDINKLVYEHKKPLSYERSDRNQGDAKRCKLNKHPNGNNKTLNVSEPISSATANLSRTFANKMITSVASQANEQ